MSRRCIYGYIHIISLLQDIVPDHLHDFWECGYLEMSVLALVDMELCMFQFRRVFLCMSERDDGIIMGKEEMDMFRVFLHEGEVGLQFESPAQILPHICIVEGRADEEKRCYSFRKSVFGQVLREEDAAERIPDEDDTISEEWNVPLEMNLPILIPSVVLERHAWTDDLEILAEFLIEILPAPSHFPFQ